MALKAIAVLLLLTITSARKLPSFVHICNRTSTNLNQCLKNSVEALRPYLGNGIREMHIPTLEPLQIPHAELDTGATFKAIFKNIHVFGLTSFNIRNISMNLDGNVVDLDLQFPFVRTTADYSIKGRLLILQLNGFGKCQGSYKNLQTRAVISGERFTKRGKEYINFSKVKLNLHFGPQNALTFENIFRDNKELTDQTNKIISENIEGIMTEIKPVFDETVAQLALGLLKGVFNRYSVDELFPKK